MQYDDEKSLHLTHILGQTIKDLRKEYNNISLNKLANEYDLKKGTLSKIEKGNVNCKFINVWKIANALGFKFSDFVKILEEKLGEDFSLIDE